MTRDDLKSRHSNIVLLLLLVGSVLVIIMLRETGYMNLNMYVSSSTTQKAIQGGGLSLEHDGQPVDLSRVALNSIVTTSIKSITTKTTAEALRKLQLSGTGPYQGQVITKLQRLELDGPYWLPLYKQGRCDFVAICELKAEFDGSSVHQYVKVEGHIDCRVKGVCSIHKFH